MKIVNTETLATTKYLNFNATEYKDQNDDTKFWVWCSRPNGMKAVVIAAIVDNGFLPNTIPYKRDLRLVVIREMRIPVGDYEWGFPAGLIDGDEDTVVAATRELKEESGLTVKKVLKVGPFVYNSAGLTDETISMVFVECEGKISKEGLESSEDIDTFLMTQEEVINLLKDTNKKFGAKFWIVADHFANYNCIC